MRVLRWWVWARADFINQLDEFSLTEAIDRILERRCIIVSAHGGVSMNYNAKDKALHGESSIRYDRGTIAR